MAKEAPKFEQFNHHVSESHSDANSSGIILMCRKCNNAVADSMAWVCSNRELHTITVHSVSKKVRVKEKLSTSGEGHDIGSTFTNLSCIHCDSTVGKIYKTTPRHMDEIRDLFTLDVNALECYQLGGPDVQTADKETDENGWMGFPDVNQLVTQINKIQSIMLVFNERITKLEEMMKFSDSAEQPTDEEDKENASDESGCEVSLSSVVMHRNSAKSNKSVTISPVRVTASHPSKSPQDVKPNINKIHKKRPVDLDNLEKQGLHRKKKK